MFTKEWTVKDSLTEVVVSTGYLSIFEVRERLLNYDTHRHGHHELPQLIVKT